MSLMQRLCWVYLCAEHRRVLEDYFKALDGEFCQEGPRLFICIERIKSWSAPQRALTGD